MSLGTMASWEDAPGMKKNREARTIRRLTGIRWAISGFFQELRIH
jgi:hypothetical protein